MLSPNPGGQIRKGIVTRERREIGVHFGRHQSPPFLTPAKRKN